MQRRLLWACLVLLPLCSSFVTYTFVSSGNAAIALDSTQAAILCIALIKMALLGSTGVFPIDLDDVFSRVWKPFGRERRDAPDSLFKHPPVSASPCLRRLLCEVETAARTSDDYVSRAVSGVNGRTPADEVSPEEVDPLTELYTEAVRAMYGHTEPSSPDCTPHTQKALHLLNTLNADNCEMAYTLCPGRLTAPMVFKYVLTEIGLRAKDTSAPLDPATCDDPRAGWGRPGSEQAGVDNNVKNSNASSTINGVKKVSESDRLSHNNL